MEPIALEIWRRPGGEPDLFGWGVDFEDTGLNQCGKAKTFSEAMDCIRAAINNAAEV